MRIVDCYIDRLLMINANRSSVNKLFWMFINCKIKLKSDRNAKGEIDGIEMLSETSMGLKYISGIFKSKLT